MKLIAFLVLFCCWLQAYSNEEAIGMQESGSDLSQTIILLTAEKDQLQQENAEMKKRQTQLERNIEQLAKKSSYVIELGKMEDKYAQLVADSSAHTAELNKQISILENELSVQKEKLEQSIAEHDNVMHDGVNVKELLDRVLLLEESLRSTQEEAKHNAAIAIELEEKMSEVKSILARVSHERDQLQQDLKSAGGAVTKAQKEAHIMKDRYLTTVKKLDEQSTTIKELELHHDKCKEMAIQHEAAVTALQFQANASPFRKFIYRLGRLKDFILRLFRLKK